MTKGEFWEQFYPLMMSRGSRSFNRLVWWELILEPLEEEKIRDKHF